MMSGEKLSKASDRPNLVLIHGWGYDKSCWPAELLSTLKAQFNLILLQLPGHSLGDSVDDSLNNELDSVEQLDIWIQQQRALLPDDYSLLGWSLGGQVAIRFAHNNTQVQRLILLATNPKFVCAQDWECAMEVDVFSQFCSHYQNNPIATLKRFVSLQTQGCSQRIQLGTQLVRLMQPAPAKFLGLQLLGQLDEREHLSNLLIPCLIELAQADSLAPAQWIEHMPLPAQSVVNAVEGGHAYPIQDQHLGQRVVHFLTSSIPSQATS